MGSHPSFFKGERHKLGLVESGASRFLHKSINLGVYCIGPEDLGSTRLCYKDHKTLNVSLINLLTLALQVGFIKWGMMHEVPRRVGWQPTSNQNSQP